MNFDLRPGLVALVLALSAPAAVAEIAAGAYLAATAAESDNDFSEAAKYFELALQADPKNTTLIEDAMRAYVGLGQFDRALPLANQLAAAGIDSQTGAMVRIEAWAVAGDYDAIMAAQADGKLKVAPLVDGLVKGWAELGKGNSTAALADFDTVAEKASTRAFGLYHKALALALAGDYEAADAILSSSANEKLNLTRRGVVAHVEILSQLGRDADASKRLTEVFGPDLDSAMVALKARLDAGETLPMTVITKPNDGLAEVFYSVATALSGDSPDAFVLDFTRMAEALQPSHVDATLLSATLLERMKRYDLAITAFKSIPADSPYHQIAELGRADALNRAGKVDESIATLQQLSETFDTNPSIFITLGDALRRVDRFPEATTAYDRAISLFGAPNEAQWSVFFARGITYEREDKWDLAEADFRTALKLHPDQPQVLNYLGYSYVEMNRNLDEALGMIERAVAARPDDGYITDSLGWVYYRLGRYSDAVVEMEKAVSLVPVDPVINDHLGDVYWSVGRHREAEFQWQRALSFKPEDKDAERIRRKLAVGLDKVLEEEGGKPLVVPKGG